MKTGFVIETRLMMCDPSPREQVIATGFCLSDFSYLGIISSGRK